MKRVKRILALLTAVSMLSIGSTVYAEGEDDEENYDESYYSEESYDDDENDDYEYYDEESEYEDNDEEYIEESYDDYEEGDETYSEEENSEYEEEIVSEVSTESSIESSVEESSEPIINNDPLKWQKNIETIIPADSANNVAAVANSNPETKKQTETSVWEESKVEEPIEEKVLNIADIAEKEDDNISFITGVVLWTFILFLAVFLFIIFANTKSLENIPRKKYYKSPKKITKRHIR